MQMSLFAEEAQLNRLSKLGDSLEKLKIIDFEAFRPLPDRACIRFYDSVHAWIDDPFHRS